MTIHDILHELRRSSFTEREKGHRFESLMRNWLLTDKTYSGTLSEVWMWSDFPYRKDFGGSDTGIDLVARTADGAYWAIQCKCYDKGTAIGKPAVDSFLATSGKSFVDEQGQTRRFAHRLWLDTAAAWGPNAEAAIHHQTPPVSRVGLHQLAESPVDWEALYKGSSGAAALGKAKAPMAHQLEAVAAAQTYYGEHDRGKLIMACGTGKTYTALLIAEKLLPQKGLVLFMVPSIGLLNQSLNAWMADATRPMRAVCICSDATASQKKKAADDDSALESVEDLALPASTNPETICRQLRSHLSKAGLTVVFSTYQSIDAVHEVQQTLLRETGGAQGLFDLAVCDEAHRTTGARLSDADESSFTKIHSDGNVRAARRLYMTATPRLYGENAKIQASRKECILCSMDDEALYGEEFFRVDFSYAVDHQLLTDYKVMVLTVSERNIPESLRKAVADSTARGYDYDDTIKLAGVVSGLSKRILGDDGITAQTDPYIMRRAVVFCSSIGRADKPGTSKNVAEVLPVVSREMGLAQPPEHTHARQERLATVTVHHVDGAMSARERAAHLHWLAETPDNPDECRVLTNVRCLSEGIDVPSLDAVVFLSPRNSQVDVVQSVGRVMRNFHKGQTDGKRYGYIIIPIVVPEDAKAEDALDDNARYKVVWDILNALRSHDDRFNAYIQQISVNLQNADGDGKDRQRGSGKIVVVTPDNVMNGNAGEVEPVEPPLRQLVLPGNFQEMQAGLYAKLVVKCGDKCYWENWAKSVGEIAISFMERIRAMVSSGAHKAEFQGFLQDLQRDLNPAVDEEQAIQMLAQHAITGPVFDALFKDYRFVTNNPVSRSMQKMLEMLHEAALEKDTQELERFYASVRRQVSEIDTLRGRQQIIKELYEKFFKAAFPKTVEQLGIVYTPVECVDFILHSVEALLKREFGTSLTEEKVHVLDPFTGTGTFITRLLQSGLIRPEDLERKYRGELHCNEVVLLAYYIADVNIEAVFHDLTRRPEYLTYDGICLTDTFQLAEERHNPYFTGFFQDNAQRLRRQRQAPVRVIIGNPPYSVGQKSANDNAQNLHYRTLDARIANTYAKEGTAKLQNSLYDSYIKAFRWASDRLPEDQGGIVAFISNGAWLDGSAQDGMRRCLEREFTSIYVLNLRGNQRTSGELSRREGGKIFGSGSRTPIAITLLVKNPAKRVPGGKAQIYYHDIGDYLTREQKLEKVEAFASIDSPALQWTPITPNDKADWINQRDGLFDTLIPIGDKDHKDNEKTFFVPMYSCGLKTQRDAWCYNSSSAALEANIRRSIDFYNQQREALAKGKQTEVNYDATKFSWTVNTLADVRKGLVYDYACGEPRQTLYRPFFKQRGFYSDVLNERRGQLPQLFPTADTRNLVICCAGVGVTKDFSCIITDQLPDLELIGKSQCFPLYWYEEKHSRQGTLFDMADDGRYTRHDGISDWILAEFRKRFHGAASLTKEDIFYYVYGLLHSPDYRTRFADDLKKALPRLPIVETVEEFLAFSKAGRELAELHLGYEALPPPEGVTVEGDCAGLSDTEAYGFYAVTRMAFPSKGEKGTILYNARIRVTGIPAEAYGYVVNGKSAVEWLMERYAVTIDKDSGIRNDPNDWAREHHRPRYILGLLLSVITLSLRTREIVSGLPRLSWRPNNGPAQ